MNTEPNTASAKLDPVLFKHLACILVFPLVGLACETTRVFDGDVVGPDQLADDIETAAQIDQDRADMRDYSRETGRTDFNYLDPDYRRWLDARRARRATMNPVAAAGGLVVMDVPDPKPTPKPQTKPQSRPVAQANPQGHRSGGGGHGGGGGGGGGGGHGGGGMKPPKPKPGGGGHGH